MIATLLEWLSAFIIAVISTLGYPGIVLLMILENIFMVLPSEIIMAFAGYLVWTGRFNLWWVATLGALGCNVGSSVIYYVGAKGARPFLLRYGKYLLISRREIEMADGWFEKYGHWTVFVSRLIPMIRSLIALPAGVARMNFLKFNVYTFAGSWLWCYGIAYAGYKLGSHWPTLEVYFHKFDYVIGGLLVAGILAYVWLYLKNRNRDRKAVSEILPEKSLRR